MKKNADEDSGPDRNRAAPLFRMLPRLLILLQSDNSLPLHRTDDGRVQLTEEISSRSSDSRNSIGDRRPISGVGHIDLFRGVMVIETPKFALIYRYLDRPGKSIVEEEMRGGAGVACCD